METKAAASKPSYESWYPAQPTVLHATRNFDGEWCCCFGDCDGPGWIGCLLGSFCPCIAIGQNLLRATGNVSLGLLVGLAFCVLTIGQLVAGYFRSTCEEVDCSFEESCDTRTVCTLNMKALIGYLALFGATMLIGFFSRRHIGKMLKMDGHETAGCDDFLSWCCCRFGLCQETRTMMINRVENGVWRGPQNMQTVIVMAPPQTSVMAKGSAVGFPATNSEYHNVEQGA